MALIETTKPVLILATRNKNKITEIKSILGDLFDYRLISQYFDFNIRETGRTLHDNSMAKAIMAFKLANQPALADDSGLFVEALDGEPGVFSARYGKTDMKRIERLLTNMSAVENRRAVFRAVFVYYYGANAYKIFEGECKGTITLDPRGVNGFGYDPVFIPEGRIQTFAQMDASEKNQISHRARALLKFREYITESPTMVD